jgi:hypothetical protein
MLPVYPYELRNQHGREILTAAGRFDAAPAPARHVPNHLTHNPGDFVMWLQQAVPASQAIELPEIAFPGLHISGHSVVDSVSEEEPKRIPTVFAPFYSGCKFRLAERESPPGTTLFLTNLTLLVANGTYESLFTSGMMDFFSLGTAARICVANRCDPAHSKRCARSAALRITDSIMTWKKNCGDFGSPAVFLFPGSTTSRRPSPCECS